MVKGLLRKLKREKKDLKDKEIEEIKNKTVENEDEQIEIEEETEEVVEEARPEEEKQNQKEKKRGFFKFFSKRGKQEIKIEKDLEEEIKGLNIEEEIKEKWLSLYERVKNCSWDKELEDIIRDFKLNYKSVKDLKEASIKYGVSPLIFLIEIARILSADELLSYWETKYGIKYDSLFTVHDYIFEIPNNSKRVAEFLVGEGQISNKEIAIYTPLDLIRLLEELVYAIKLKNVLDNDEGKEEEKYLNYKKLYRYYAGEIVLVNFSIFENKELLRRTEKKEGKGEITKDVKQKFLRIIKNAIQLGASDIHFSPKKNFVEVKIRLFGDLTIFQYLSHPEWQAMMRVIKTMAAESGSTIEVDEWRKEQDAKLNLPQFGVDLRLAFTPSLVEKEQYLVSRILYKGKTVKVEKGKEAEVIKNLGYFPEDSKWLAEYIMTKEKGQGGILIMSGATGSGKSMTLNYMLALIPSKRAIKTIEDPVEYRLENADQHEVLEFIKEDKPMHFGFLEAIREFMRQDPDIIFVGEWRKNKELTSGLTYACKTGHFVLTTLHSSRVVGIPDLLLSDYEVDQPTQANTLSLLISQRLLKTVCSNCALIEPIGFFQIKEIVEKMQFMDRETLFEILDVFENPNTKIFFGNIELTIPQRIPLKEFVKLVNDDKISIWLEIPEFLSEMPKDFNEYRELKKLHYIPKDFLEVYKEKIGKYFNEILDKLYEVVEKRKKGLELTEIENEIFSRYSLSKEETEEGIFINTEKFLKLFLFPMTRKLFKNELNFLREKIKYISPKINPQGCIECIKRNPQTGQVVSAGVKGRTPVYEYLYCDTEVKEKIFETTEAIEIEKMLIKKSNEYTTNKDLSLTPKARSFVNVFTKKLKENYKWNIPFSEIQKLL